MTPRGLQTQVCVQDTCLHSCAVQRVLHLCVNVVLRKGSSLANFDMGGMCLIPGEQQHCKLEGLFCAQNSLFFIEQIRKSCCSSLLPLSSQRHFSKLIKSSMRKVHVWPNINIWILTFLGVFFLSYLFFPLFACLLLPQWKEETDK